MTTRGTPRSRRAVFLDHERADSTSSLGRRAVFLDHERAEGTSSLGRRAVFLDRDGTLNRDSPDYVKSWSEFSWLPEVFAPLRRLREAGFHLVVVTNQGAIAKGRATVEAVEALHARMREDLLREGVDLAGVYYCPHHDADGCACRKPRPGLLLRAAEDLGIDLRRSWMVGDTERDEGAGRAAGCRVVRVGSDAPLARAVEVILAAEADPSS